MASTVELRMDPTGEAAALSSPKAVALMGSECRKIAKRATSAGAGFHTKRRYSRGVQVAGGKAPEYGARVRVGDGGAHGAVYTANYAAIVYESKTNTLLRVRG